MPAPMSRSASSTLTPAMMPSSRFDVSRFPAFISSLPSMRGPRRRVRRLLPRRVEFVHHPDAVVGHVAELDDRLLKAREFVPQIVDGWLQPVADVFSLVSKEEVTHRGADQRPDDC